MRPNAAVADDAARAGSDVATLGRVAIVGAGQVGTMLGMALRDAGAADVALFDAEPAVAALSLARGAGSRAVRTAAHALDADTVVLALPVPAIVAFLFDHASSFRPGSLVLDTGSAKAAVVEAMRSALPPQVHAVGGHPVAGTERPGPEGARPELLRGAAFVLTPVRPDPDGMARAESLARAVGSRPVRLEAEAHDRLLARTSHLPHVVSFVLAAVAAAAVRDGERLDEVAGPGFASATRLAASDPGMVAGFLTANAGEVRAALAELRRALDALDEASRRGEPALAAALAAARVALEEAR